MSANSLQLKLSDSFQVLGRYIGIFIFLSALLVLVGWYIDNPILQRLYPTLPNMKANTAVCFLLLSINLWLINSTILSDKPEIKRFIILGGALCVFIIASLTLLQYIGGWNFGIDQLLFIEPLTPQSAPWPGRMALSTAIGFLIYSFTYLGISSNNLESQFRAKIANLFPLFIGTFSMVGYLYQEKTFYTPYEISMALNTAILMVAMSVGLIFSQPEEKFVAMVTSNTSGGIITRRFLPLGVIGTIFLGLILKLLGERYQTEESTQIAIFVTVTLLIIIPLILTTAYSLFMKETESQQAAERIRQSEEHFRLFTTQVEDYAIYMLDPAGFITSWNIGAQRLKGYTVEEILGKNYSKFYTPVDIQKGLPEFGLKQAALHQKYSEEGWRLRKDGSEFWAKATMSAIRDPSGNLLGFAKVNQDLTEHKTYEDALCAKLKELSDIKHAIDAATMIVMANNQRVITYVNDAFCEFSKYTREDLTGNTHDIVNPEFHPRQFFQEIWGRSTVWHGEMKNKAKDGSYYWLDVTIFPCLDTEGKPETYIAILHNITPLKRVEESISKQAYHQKILSLIGKKALLNIPINQLLEQIVMILQKVFEVEFSEIWELQEVNQSFLLKAGSGWEKEEIGTVSISNNMKSQAGYTALLDEPVIVEDTTEEKRFDLDPMLAEHGVRSGISTLIYSNVEEKLYGILGIHSIHPRKYTVEETNFLQAVANIIGVAIERKKAEERLLLFGQELEQKVEEKTSTLAEVNAMLKIEIQERIDTEKALRDNERKFRAIFNQTF
jgi:PAS domain S-box-containing protein